MQRFDFYQEEVIKTVRRTDFSIEAETKEEAIKKAAVLKDKSFWETELEDGNAESELDDNAEKTLTPEENNGNATLLTYYANEDKVPIYKNVD